jgi:hypothetical protein
MYLGSKKGILKNSRYGFCHLNGFLAYLCAHKRFSNLIKFNHNESICFSGPRIPVSGNGKGFV